MKFKLIAILITLVVFCGCIKEEKKNLYLSLADLGCTRSVVIQKSYEENSITVKFPLSYYCSEIKFITNYSIEGRNISIKILNKEAEPTRCVCNHVIELKIENLTERCYYVKIYDNDSLIFDEVVTKSCPKLSLPSPDWYENCIKNDGYVIVEKDECDCELTPKCLKNECKNDEDCAVGGCNGEVCSSKKIIENIITPCVWKDEYSCLRTTRCKCINGKCDWEINEDYLSCIQNLIDRSKIR